MDPDLPAPLEYGRRTPRPVVRRAIRWTAIVSVTLVGSVVLLSVLPIDTAHNRKAAYRAVCLVHERQVGLALAQYQQGHDGHYPPALADLAAEGQIGLESLVCRASTDTTAAISSTSPDAPTTRQVAAALAVPGHLSYLYCGRSEWTATAVPADAIVLYESPANHDGNGSNILFGDGHAEWVSQPRAARLIAAAAASTQPVLAATVP